MINDDDDQILEEYDNTAASISELIPQGQEEDGINKYYSFSYIASMNQGFDVSPHEHCSFLSHSGDELIWNCGGENFFVENDDSVFIATLQKCQCNICRPRVRSPSMGGGLMRGGKIPSKKLKK